MKTVKWLIIFIAGMVMTYCSDKPTDFNVLSPRKLVQLHFVLRKGVPYYNVNSTGKEVIRPSRMGFVLQNGEPMDRGFKIIKSTSNSIDTTWEQPWGEERLIRNNYNELKVYLVDDSPAKRKLNIIFRVFDDGIGFRYEFPKQEGLGVFNIMDEETEFVFPEDFSAWWIPAFKPERYEYLYKKSPISQLDTVHTPLTIETGQGLYLSIHEANLTDYASMTLVGQKEHKLKCYLVPWADGVKVKAQVPFVSPWRTIQIADKPGDLITSYLELNLNEPNKLGDVSWVKPGKYVGIWWGMHIGTYTWASGRKHGATTKNAKRYIDFAAKHGIAGVLVEGWNIGWDGDWIQNGKLFSFTKPYPDYDIKEVARYAKEKGVQLIGHTETSADIGNFDSQMDDAFNMFDSLGIHIVKSGYVGKKVTSVNGVREWHHGQYMVRHYRKVVEAAARHKIMLDVHEPIKDTGIRRTYPNMMSREGARGQEYNAWSPDGGNPPEHITIIPFTRGLAGPFDFTPGIFDLLFKKAGRPDNRVNTTLAKQLAEYVVIYSPLVMAADLIENYDNNPAFKFIEQVPTDWETTKVLNAKIGDYVTIARKVRNGDTWYLGSVTDENSRTLDLKFDFLDQDKQYTAKMYLDGPDADWKTNPYPVDIKENPVDYNSVYELKLAPGGGAAMIIKPVE